MQRNIKRQLFKLSNLKKLSFLIFILFLFYKKYICICHPERLCLCVIIYIDVNVVSLNCTAAILSCKYMTSDDHFRSARNNSWINRNRLTFYYRRSCCCNSVCFITAVFLFSFVILEYYISRGYFAVSSATIPLTFSILSSL